MSQTLTPYITRPCFFCGKTSTQEVTTDQAQALTAGEPVQDVLPELPAPERELFITGTHPACWEAMFGPAMA